MKGVMIPGVSAGSNQVGARETWTAHVAWPSGAAMAAGGEGTAATTATRAAARAVRRARAWSDGARRSAMAASSPSGRRATVGPSVRIAGGSRGGSRAGPRGSRATQQAPALEHVVERLGADREPIGGAGLVVVLGGQG